LANPIEVKQEYDLLTTNVLPNQKFDAVVLGVAHHQFLTIDISKLQNDISLLYDVKGILGDAVDGRL
jgi:UDP-N-acetyl-D-glucosamine/UDP-N-acetyl-D-galactosamine dehydrogenase